MNVKVLIVIVKPKLYYSAQLLSNCYHEVVTEAAVICTAVALLYATQLPLLRLYKPACFRL